MPCAEAGASRSGRDGDAGPLTSRPVGSGSPTGGVGGVVDGSGAWSDGGTGAVAKRSCDGSRPPATSAAASTATRLALSPARHGPRRRPTAHDVSREAPLPPYIVRPTVVAVLGDAHPRMGHVPVKPG